jgi:hypothetical protein
MKLPESLFVQTFEELHFAVQYTPMNQGPGYELVMVAGYTIIFRPFTVAANQLQRSFGIGTCLASPSH